MANAAELVWTFLAKDHVSDTAKNVGKSLGDLEGKTKAFNSAASLISAGAIVAFGAASVKAFAEAEQQQSKLTQAYARFPAMAKVNIDSLRAYNDELEKKTATDADSIAAAQAQLAAFKLNGEEIQRLTPLLVDYAQATGRDVTDASTVLGKALMGNGRALKEIGIEFTATGDRSKDLATLMGLLQEKVGGAGEAFRATGAGSMKELQLQIGNLEESVGSILLPALTNLANILTPMAESFAKLPQPLQNVAVGLGTAAAATLLLGPRIITLATALRGIAPAAMQAVLGLKAEGAAATTAAAENEVAAGRAAGAWKAAALSIGIVMLGVGGASEASTEVQRQTFEKQDQQLADWANSHKDKMGEAKKALEEYAARWGISSDKIADAFPKAAAAVGLLPPALDAVTSSGDSATAAVDAVATTAQSAYDPVASLKQAAEGLKAALDALGGKQISLDDAMSNLYRSFNDATAAMKDLEGATQKGGTELNLHTEAGQKAQSALAGIAKAADDAATAQAAAGASTKDIKDRQIEARDAFIEAAKAAGITASGAAEKLAEKYGLIPDKVATQVTIEKTAEAIAKAETVRRTVGLIPPEARVTTVADGVPEVMGQLGGIRGRALALDGVHPIITVSLNQGQTQDDIEETQRRLHRLDGNTANVYIVTHNVTASAGGGPIRKAVGGVVTGPGTATSDSVPAMLSNGEFVIQASTVSKLGVGWLSDLNDNGQIDHKAAGGIISRYATGGRVSAASTGRTPRSGLSALIRDTAALNDAQAILAEMVKNQKETARSIAETMAATGGLFQAFKVGQLPDALKALADANRALNLANSESERADALKARADAQAAVAAARPTGANVLAGLKGKLAGIKGFYASLKSLKKKGLPGHLIKQLVDAGPVDGQEMAKALLDASPADLKSIIATDAAIVSTSASIGTMTTQALIGEQRAVVNRAAATARQDAVYVSSVKLQLDSREVASALLAYKKAMGNRPLGIS